jgi:hypothetical protein
MICRPLISIVLCVKSKHQQEVTQGTAKEYDVVDVPKAWLSKRILPWTPSIKKSVKKPLEEKSFVLLRLPKQTPNIHKALNGIVIDSRVCYIDG